MNPQTPESPEVVPTQRIAAQTYLRLVVLLQCIGVGGRYFFSQHESESDVYGLLYFDWNWPEVTAQRIDDLGTLACFIAGLMVVLGASLNRLGGNCQATLPTTSMQPSLLASSSACLEYFTAAVIAVWMLLLAAVHTVRGEVYAELTLGEHAVRFAAPIALMLLVGFQRSAGNRGQRPWIAIALLVVASATTCTVHGYKATQLYGPFTDLILLSDARWMGLELKQSTAESALFVIGIVDIVLAVLLLATRWRWIALYMVVWGLITATSRMTAFGWAAWPETFIRAANWGAPLAAALLLNSYESRLAESLIDVDSS